MKKTVSVLLIAAALLLCLVPSAGMLLTGPSEGAANEVRTPLPSLRERDGSLNTGYFSRLGGYLDSHFALRQECITAWAWLNAALFRTSTAPGVVLGTDGFLFYQGTLADYTNTAPMTERELWCAARTLKLLQDYAEARGADFLFTLAPNKNSLYGEAMPPLAVQPGERNAQRFYALLSEMDVHFTDLFAAFAAEDELLYYRTDTHWNSRGAALAADAILRALDRESGFFDAAFLPGAEHRGDLYEMLYPAGKKTEADPAYAPGHTFTADTDDPDAIRITTSGGGKGQLLCYRDSFGAALYPYLADRFAVCTFSRENDRSPVSLSEGDAMVVELVERSLCFLCDCAPTMPAPRVDAVSPEHTEGEAAVKEEKCSLDGYRRYTGTFSGITPADDASVVLVTDAGAFEAFPTPEGFSLCLPEEIDLFTGGCCVCLDTAAVPLRRAE